MRYEDGISEERFLELAARTQRNPKRIVCGKPHRTREQAEAGARTARLWGWEYVDVEEKAAGYFVVTGYPLYKHPHDKGGISPGNIQGRYRWPGRK